jgi:chemotaxis protein CheD
MPSSAANRQPESTRMLVVGVADMRLSEQPGDMLVTHALASCIGLALHDAQAGVGGILHFMLPTAAVNPERAERNPFIFGDTGIPAFFNAAWALGAKPERLRVVMAGGAQVIDAKDFFAIGKRNQTVVRQLLWKSRLLIDGEHVGGTLSRTLVLEVGSGRTWVKYEGREIEL